MTPTNIDQTELVQDLIILRGITPDEAFFNLNENVMAFKWLAVTERDFKFAVANGQPAVEAFESRWIGIKEL